MSNCAGCGAVVDNPAVTGILCQACYTKDVAPQPAWKAYVSGPTATGFVALAIPFAVSFRVNALDYVGLGCSALAALCGIVGIIQAGKLEPEFRNKRRIGAIVVLALGALRLLQFGAPLL